MRDDDNGNGAARFLSLSGLFKEWANLGIAGVMCGLLVWFAISQRSDARSDRETSRQEMLESRNDAKEAHKSMGQMTDALRENSHSIEALRYELRSVREAKTKTKE